MAVDASPAVESMQVTSSPSSRPRLLYLSLSDGSDPRINKEIATLSQAFAIDFVGVSTGPIHSFITGKVRSISLIGGRRRSPATLLRLAWRVLQLRCANKYASAHVINENLYLLLWPVLIGQRVVLDVFDSIFLKTQLPAWLVRLGQRFCYACPARVIVTDDERAALFPDFARHKLVVLPNYPFRYQGGILPREPSVVRVLYVGSLLESRGTFFIRNLLAAAQDVRVVMAGWQHDAPSVELAQHPRVEWLGILPQAEIIAQATRCDFILCHYEPINVNNIYASPNKIYDAIQAGAAVIINPEVKIASFVRDQNLGVVLPAYRPVDYQAVAQSLREFKATRRARSDLSEQYVWESLEPRLLAAHGWSATGAQV